MSQAGARSDGGTLVIRNVTLYDGTGASAQVGMDVVVSGERIESVHPTDPSTYAEATVLDGSGRFLIPGLIDAHVHLSGSSRRESQQVLAWALAGGVTAVRDMAGDARELAELSQALSSGQLEGPRLYYSGLMAGPPFLSDPRLQAATAGYEPGEAPYMVPLTSETDLPSAVAGIRGTGATGVKLYAALDSSLVRAATHEAQRAGLQVWAHSAVFPAKPVEIIEAGVDAISHAPYVIWEAAPATPDFTLRARGDFARVPASGPAMDRVIQAMVRNETVLDPTLFVFARDAARQENPRRLPWAAEFTQRAHQAGVTIAAGTDGIGQPDRGSLPNVHTELELLVDLAGLTPLQALTAATYGGARAIGAEDDIGTIASGMVADLVLLSRDPALDIDNTRSIDRVISRGRVVSR